MRIFVYPRGDNSIGRDDYIVRPGDIVASATINAQIKSEMFLDDEISDLEDTSDIDVPELDSDVSFFWQR
ncbi:hypothetical protein J6590_100182 [Homalodisca vitripennis]|nr:hypothetical protein J6590_100182 [Homalodisca vitripennis]